MTPKDKEDDNDFAFEPIKGLPEELPEGETILWSGSPEKWAIGTRVFHARAIFAVFAILAISSLFSSLTPDASIAQRIGQCLSILAAGGAYVALATFMGWLIAINTVYTLTNKRIVIRHGVTMPMAINLPFSKVASAALRSGSDGAGDVSVTLLDGNHVSLFALWPHNRPWSWQGAAPAFKCIADADRVAQILHDALVADAASAGQSFEGERPRIPVRTHVKNGAFAGVGAAVAARKTAQHGHPETASAA